jgi:hypothetical protein
MKRPSWTAYSSASLTVDIRSLSAYKPQVQSCLGEEWTPRNPWPTTMKPGRRAQRPIMALRDGHGDRSNGEFSSQRPAPVSGLMMLGRAYQMRHPITGSARSGAPPRSNRSWSLTWLKPAPVLVSVSGAGTGFTTGSTSMTSMNLDGLSDVRHADLLVLGEPKSAHDETTSPIPDLSGWHLLDVVSYRGLPGDSPRRSEWGSVFHCPVNGTPHRPRPLAFGI